VNGAGVGVWLSNTGGEGPPPVKERNHGGLRHRVEDRGGNQGTARGSNKSDRKSNYGNTATATESNQLSKKDLAPKLWDVTQRDGGLVNKNDNSN